MLNILSVPQIATYIAYVFIVVVYAVKIVKIARMPMHLRWELYPLPHEKGYRHGGSYFEEPEWWNKPRRKNLSRSILFKLRDYLIFPGYFHRNKGYWLGLYPWHIGFYALMSFQLSAFCGALITLTTGIAISPDSANIFGQIIYYFTLIVAVTSFILGGIGSFILLLNRIIVKEFRTYTSTADYLGYLFFLILFLSLAFAWRDDITFSSYRDFWRGLITFQYVYIKIPLYMFVMLFALHLIHLPFTRSTHYIAKIFAFFGVLWDDAPNLKGTVTEKALKQMLCKPVSWSAPHIQQGKTWSDVVKGMPEDSAGNKK